MVTDDRTQKRHQKTQKLEIASSSDFELTVAVALALAFAAASDAADAPP